MIQRRVATFTLNPAYDLVGRVDQLCKAEVNQITTMGLHAAGKGINVARVLNDLGIKVIVGGILGEENLEGFTSLFDQLNLVNRYQTVLGRTRINVKITEGSQKVTDLNFTGFSVDKASWQRFYQDSLTWVAEVDMVCVSGSLPQGISSQAFAQWLTDLKQRCPCLILDTSRQALMAGLAVNPWLIKPNQDELAEWIGRPLTDLADIIAVAQQLHAKGIAHVMVSLGGDGAIWISAEGTWLAQPPSCEVVSTVGAGDSMVAGVIYGLLMGESIPDTLRLATAVATLAVGQNGVGVSDRSQLAAFIPKVALRTVANIQA